MCNRDCKYCFTNLFNFDQGTYIISLLCSVDIDIIVNSYDVDIDVIQVKCYNCYAYSYFSDVSNSNLMQC